MIALRFGEWQTPLVAIFILTYLMGGIRLLYFFGKRQETEQDKINRQSLHSKNDTRLRAAG